MRKIIFLLALLASTVMFIQTGIIKNASATDKSMMCITSYDSNGGTRVTCSGSGTDCTKTSQCAL